jgi:hypothetical protein
MSGLFNILFTVPKTNKVQNKKKEPIFDFTPYMEAEDGSWGLREQLLILIFFPLKHPTDLKL